MLTKLQMDFPILGSTRTSPNTGLPPLEKLELITRDRKQRVLHGGRFKKGFGEVRRPKHSNGGSVVVHEVGLKKRGFVKNPDEEKGLENLGDGGFVERKDFGVELGLGGGNGVVKKVQTKCSTKWLSYGGCIPAMLTALEEVEDLDEAPRPWGETLSNKERSIILKEQRSWERALEIFEWFKKKRCYELHVIHYNIVLRILGKAKKWSHLRSLWDEMNVERIAPINSTYGTLIDVYRRPSWSQSVPTNPDENALSLLIPLKGNM